MRLNPLLISILAIMPGILAAAINITVSAATNTIAERALDIAPDVDVHNWVDEPKPGDKPPHAHVEHRMSKRSLKKYYELIIPGRCQELREAEYYGDRGSYLNINAGVPIKCEMFELGLCRNPLDPVFKHVSPWDDAVYKGGFDSWPKTWTFRSYRCDRYELYCGAGNDICY